MEKNFPHLSELVAFNTQDVKYAAMEMIGRPTKTMKRSAELAVINGKSSAALVYSGETIWDKLEVWAKNRQNFPIRFNGLKNEGADQSLLRFADLVESVPLAPLQIGKMLGSGNSETVMPIVVKNGVLDPTDKAAALKGLVECKDVKNGTPVAPETVSFSALANSKPYIGK